MTEIMNTFKGKMSRTGENRKIKQYDSFENLLFFVFLPLTQALVVHSHVLFVHEM